MAKAKNKQGVAPPLKHPQAFERLKFLHQAAMLMSTIQYNDTKSRKKNKLPSKGKKKQIRKRKGDKEVKIKKWSGDPEGTLLPVARYLNNNMKQITARMVLRLDPNVKRTVCKRCDTSIIPAITSSMRIQSTPVATAVQTCKICNGKKRFTTQKPDFLLFNDKHDIAKVSEENDSVERDTHTPVSDRGDAGKAQDNDEMEICT